MKFFMLSVALSTTLFFSCRKASIGLPADGVLVPALPTDSLVLLASLVRKVLSNL